MFQSVNDILRYICAYDKQGKSATEIDTQEEYDMLGEYLNGMSCYVESSNGNVYEHSYADLSLQDKNFLFSLIDSLKSKFGEWINTFATETEVDNINVSSYIFRLKEFQKRLDNAPSDVERQEYYENIKEEYETIKTKLQNFCNNYEITVKTDENSLISLNRLFQDLDIEMKLKSQLQNIDENFEITDENADEYAMAMHYLQDEEIHLASEKNIKILINAYKKFFSIYTQFAPGETIDVEFHIEQRKAVLEKNNLIKKCADIVQSTVNNPYDNNKLKNSVKQYIKANNIPILTDIPEGIDIGNGKFDKVSTQKSNNCWVHAGINSMLTTEEGRQIVTSNYYRDKQTGVVAVHIPEAEALGLHDGIFYITPEEIINANDTVAEGEGDITAYIIAIQKYFDEVKSHPELQDNNNRNYADVNQGNTGYRFYELMTGGECVVDEGIGVGIRTDINPHYNIDDLYNMVEKGEGVVVLSEGHIEHAISIIGVKDGKFLVQESNNLEDIFDNHMYNDNRVFNPTKPVNGKPTFEISKEYMQTLNIGALSYIKWK